MELLLVKLIFQTQLGTRPQCLQVFVSVVEGGCLCRGPESVAIDLGLCIVIIQYHFLHQYPLGFFSIDSHDGALKKSVTKLQRNLKSYMADRSWVYPVAQRCLPVPNNHMAWRVQLVHNAVFKQALNVYAVIGAHRFVPVSRCGILLCGVWRGLNV